MNGVKIAALILSIVTLIMTVFYLSVYASTQYPQVDDLNGVAIRVYRLNEQPRTWTTIESDKYIADAVSRTANVSFSLSEMENKTSFTQIMLHASWNRTWIPDGDPSIEWAGAGRPTYIFWSPDENFYYVEFRYSDDFMPAWFKDLPAPPTQTAGFLGAAWLSLGLFAVYRTKSNRKHEQMPRTQ
jgi:hypothetical protein